jgi:D-alanyl-D-alanine carboxypeptidase
MGIISRWLAFLAAPCWLALAASVGATEGDLRSRAEALVNESWPADGPGAAVIVTKGGETVYTGTRGLADVEAQRPITAETVFRLGSITKQFAAALVLKLAEEGLLALDDPLGKFVPGYPEPGSRATVRQLLNHTSGIQSYTSIPGWNVEANTSRAFTTGQLILEFRDHASQFEPGADHAYNNSGYVLLAAVVESVTGQPWHVALEERITGPLMLTSIRYGEQEAEIAASARPYSSGPDGLRPAQAIHMSVPSAGGALIGSVGDLAKWAAALHHGKVVGAESYAQMIAPTVLPGGRTVPYGYGLSTESLRGLKVIGHGGGIFGGLTDSLYLPEQDLFVAVFVNSDSPARGPGIVARRLAAMAAGQPFPEFQAIAVDLAALESFLGVYSVAEDEAEWRFYARDGRLFIQRGEGPEQPIHAAEGERFFYGPNSLTWYQGRRRPAGAVVLERHSDGSDEFVPLTRTGPIPPPPVVPRAVLERYVGRYQLEGTVATIGLTADNRLTVQLTGQPVANPLRTVGPNEFAGDAAGVRVSFEGEGPRATRLNSRMGPIVNSGPRLPDAN